MCLVRHNKSCLSDVDGAVSAGACLNDGLTAVVPGGAGCDMGGGFAPAFHWAGNRTATCHCHCQLTWNCRKPHSLPLAVALLLMLVVHCAHDRGGADFQAS